MVIHTADGLLCVRNVAEMAKQWFNLIQQTKINDAHHFDGIMKEKLL